MTYSRYSWSGSTAIRWGGCSGRSRPACVTWPGSRRGRQRGGNCSRRPVTGRGTGECSPITTPRPASAPSACVSSSPATWSSSRRTNATSCRRARRPSWCRPGCRWTRRCARSSPVSCTTGSRPWRYWRGMLRGQRGMSGSAPLTSRKSNEAPQSGRTAMKVGIPREIKNHEYRVAITPAGVHELVRGGHQVLIEAGAGNGSSIPDEDFVTAGAKILPTADDVWGEGDMILKVKEPIAEEYHRMRSGQVLFTYLHLAASKACTDALLSSGITSIAYETVQLPDGSLPLLAPMSEVAGRMAPQVGAHHLQRDGGGRGVLMGGVSGVYAAKVVVLGAGVSGMNAAAIALGMQAEVLLVDRNIARLRQADAIYQGHLQTVASNAYEIERAVIDADLVIGAVLVPGAKAPKLISNELVSRMKTGAVLVDISIDQGGCFEDSRPTTHAEPTYMVHGSVFYCVANMPGAVPHTSTYALANVTLPYALRLANRGWRDALKQDHSLALGLNTHDGAVTYGPVAQAHGLDGLTLEEALS